MHVLMFWGFLMLSTDMFDLASANRFSDGLLEPLGLKWAWNGMVEVGYTMAFFGCTAALTRRVAFTLRSSRASPNWKATSSCCSS